MTTNMPLHIVRGEDVTFTGTVTDQSGAVVDISAGSMVLTVKAALTDLDAAKLFQKSATGLTAQGAFTFAIADTDTISLTLDSKYYDVELTLAGSKATVAAGRFIIQPEVTKA